MGQIVGLSPVWATQQFFRDDGTPFAGGKIYTYANYSDNNQTTWADATGEVANDNPIILDSSGRMQTGLWLRAGWLYAFVLRDTDGGFDGGGNPIPGTEIARVRNVATLQLLAGSNITLDPPSGVGPVVKINAAGSVGNPQGRGQSFLFVGQNSSGNLQAGGGNFSGYSLTLDTPPIATADVTYTTDGNFTFATAGTYIVQITTTIATLNPAGYDAWPTGESVFGMVFGGYNTSYHTRYSNYAYDGLSDIYQQVTFTDEFYISVGGGSNVKSSVYLNNGSSSGQNFNTYLTFVITRIGPQAD